MHFLLSASNSLRPQVLANPVFPTNSGIALALEDVKLTTQHPYYAKIRPAEIRTLSKLWSHLKNSCKACGSDINTLRVSQVAPVLWMRFGHFLSSLISFFVDIHLLLIFISTGTYLFRVRGRVWEHSRNCVKYVVCSKSNANFEFPCYVFSIFLWRYADTHIPYLCRQVRPFWMFS